MLIFALAGFVVGALLSVRWVRSAAVLLFCACIVMIDPLDPAIWVGLAAGAVKILWDCLQS